jgi:hypothetical protein
MLNDLLLSWQRWDTHPHSQPNVMAMEDAVQDLSLRLGISGSTLRQIMIEMRLEGKTRHQIVKELYDAIDQ